MGVSLQIWEFINEAIDKYALNEPKIIVLGKQPIREDVWNKLNITDKLLDDYFQSKGAICTRINSKILGSKIPIGIRYTKFDIVININTSERVFNQHKCFRNIHNLCKKDGIFIHAVSPVGHWPDYCRYKYPRHFFNQLAVEFNYKVLADEQLPHPIKDKHDLLCSVMKKMDEKEFTKEDFDKLEIVDDSRRVRLYSHSSYEEYKEAQIVVTERKNKRVWASELDIDLLSKYIKEKLPDAHFGICHGVRNGCEVQWFRNFLNIDVIGTEISSVAKESDYVVQWDFHDIKEEWIGKADFIYSNSLDHSYNPDYCIDQWMKCLQPSGFCIVQWHELSHQSGPLKAVDCFKASKDDYEQLFSKKYKIVDILQKTEREFWFIVGHKNEN